MDPVLIKIVRGLPCTQLERLMSKYGGPKRLAEMIGVSFTTVYRWQSHGQKTLPDKYNIIFRLVAAQEGIQLTEEDLSPDDKILPIVSSNTSPWRSD